MSNFLQSGRKAACLLALAFLPLAASGQVIFDNIANPLPGNVTSLGFQATQTAEFGTGVNLGGTARDAGSAIVIMSSWACQSGDWTNNGAPCVTTPGATFPHPITLNIYQVGPMNSVGALIATRTQTFAIPFRPSANFAACSTGGNAAGGGNVGKYLDANGLCQSGFAFPITFDLSGTPLLPNQVIVTVAYNTTTFGAAPIGAAACGANCPYDALNVSALTVAPTVGSYLDPNGAYWNTQTAAYYCDGGAGGTGLLRLDTGTGCWTDNQPQIRIIAANVDAFLIRYASNLASGDSVVNLTNTGAGSTVTGIPDPQNGNICANVYTFTPDEQLASCCTCLITPNGLNSLSVKNDLASNPLTPVIPSSVVIKLVASAPVNGVCNAAKPNRVGPANVLVPGLLAWGTSLHQSPVAGEFAVTETPFSRGALSPTELQRITTLCGFIQANGSGYGVCKSCKLGGLGAAAK